MHYFNLKPYDDVSGLALTPHEVFRGRKLINPRCRSVLETSEAWPSDEFVQDAMRGIMSEREQIGQLFEDVWKEMRTVKMTEMIRKIKHNKARFEVGDYV